MKVKFNDSDVKHDVSYARETVITKFGSFNKKLELWMPDKDSFNEVVEEIASDETLTIAILDDSGDTTAAYSSYRLNQAYINFINDTDSGLECRYILLLGKQDV